MKYILHDEGRIVVNGGSATYEYHLKDLPIPIGMGNTRVSFQAGGSTPMVLQNQDYYPFGMAMNLIQNDNRYLYNGKELQDDMVNNDNLDWYDYGARFYDASIGRTTTQDPMLEKFYGLSPYSMFANNPLRFVDPTGMEIEDGSKKEWEKQKGYVEKQKSKLQAKSDGLVARAEKKGWSAEKLARKQGNLGGRISSLNSSLETMSTLESSSQVYSLSSTAPGANGGVSLNTETNAIDISFGSTSNFVHEVTHAGQFETGDIAFSSKSGAALGADIYDEVSAYKAQFAYSPSSVSGLTSTSVANSFGSITTSWVQGLAGGSLYVPLGSPNYIPGVSANTGVSPLNVNSGRSDFIRAFPKAAIMKSLPTNFILKNSSTTYYKK